MASSYALPVIAPIMTQTTQGLMIIPTESNYFIRTEVKDQQSRSEIAQRLGYLPSRVVPTPQMYSEYLKSQKLLQQDAN